MKANWRNLILEMLMVMSGVFLALLVDEWREDRQISRVVDLTEDSIIEEIHLNYQVLLGYKNNLNERFIRLQAWGEQLDLEKSFREQTGFPGIPTTSLNDAAWVRANSSDMTNYMNSEIITNAHGLYLANQRVLNSPNALLDIIYNPISWDYESTVVSYNIVEDIFREAISQVEQTVASYEEFVTLYPEEGR